jgi:hypothetical protein
VEGSEEVGVFGPSSRLGDETGGDYAGIVAAFEGVGFFAGAGVAVKVFLCQVIKRGLEEDNGHMMCKSM